MAKVSSPFKSEDARGSVGSLTATGWRSIKVLRRRANPTNKQTTRQMVVRNTLSLISRTWQTESASDRQSWSDYAQSHPQTNSLGQSFTATPANAYLGLNFLALDMSKPAVSTAPTTPPPASVVGVSESGAPALPLTGGYEVTMIVLGSAVAGDCIEVQVSRGFDSIARNAQPSDYRHYAYIAGNLTTTTISGLTIGKYYWSRYRYIDATGQATPWVKVQAVAQAGV